MSTRKRLIRKTPMQREREYHEKLLKERASRMYKRNKLFYDAFGIRPSDYYKRKEFEY
ncbi:MAG TPA: hypothetical protein H9980_08070 [Candidatus Erysipelatoclostridium merdavium]|uniref:Uncharacterized protein n=1 Tax=Candidatus Erysipelatoclostridium merdavium TaxID=2838566 RepID=A0A9D1XLV8_9FIRM|nr:hypothetical protein [Candidatus Erysipelatoclostridium merdavium]